jgi:YHS domain-containing protein
MKSKIIIEINSMQIKLSSHLFAFALLFSALIAKASSHVNVDSAGVAISGYDAVVYFKDGSPQKGNPQQSVTYQGATYYFSSESHREEFTKDPKKYVPQFGGWCAYAVAAKKAKVEIDPKSFLIQDGRLLLFFNGFLADTRKKWQNDPKNFLKTADTNWPETEKKEP